MSGLQMKYFVLSPLKSDKFGLASRKAIREYAKEIHETDLHFSDDLIGWMDRLDKSDVTEFVSNEEC